MNRTVYVLGALLAVAGAALAETQQVHVYLHSDPLHIAPEAISASLGDTLALTVENPLDPAATEQGKHDLVFEGLPHRTPLLDPGQSVPLSIPLDAAGNFPYYCSVPGHREGGMFGNLVVRATASDAQDKDAPGVALFGAVAALGLAAALRVRRP